ncbi:MAG: hypothetical protein ACM3JJ_00610 [Hyphomicrobiales bacterium]
MVVTASFGMPVVPAVANAASPTDRAASPVTEVESTSGIVYLGGNRLPPPYALSMLHGGIVVNGLRLPIPGAPKIAVSVTALAQAALAESVGANALAARDSGTADPQILEVMKRNYSRSPLVASASIDTSDAFLLVQFVDGSRFVETLPPARSARRPSLSKVQRTYLLSIKTDLDAGGMVLIVSGTERVVVPEGNIEEMQRIIDKLRMHAPVSTTEAASLSLEARQQFESPVELVPAK